MVKTKNKKKNIQQSTSDPDVLLVSNCFDEGHNNASVFEKEAEKWHKLRMRIKKHKSNPFKGCSNIRMPTLETKIRKLKASRINTVLGIRPVVQAKASPTGSSDVATKVEKLLDHLIMDVMKIRPKIIIGDDQSLEKGFYLFKPYWDRQIHQRVETLKIEDIPLSQVLQFFQPQLKRLDREKLIIDFISADMHKLVEYDNKKEIKRIIKELFAGKPEVEFSLKDVIKNQPDVALCAPERIVVPSTSGFDVQCTQWMIHEFFLPYETVKANGELKGWDVSGFDAINPNTKADLKQRNSNLDEIKEYREGIERLQETNANLVKIHEWYGWADLKGDGNLSQAIITIAPEFFIKLRKIANPYPSAHKPFVKTYYELTDDRWFSHRGIPELLEDIVKEIDVQHMQKIDSQTIRNSVMFAFRPEMVKTKTVQFKTAQGIPVHGFSKLDDVIKPIHLTNTNAEHSYKDEQMILESKAGELLGQTDFTLQSMINRREPRTASEVNFHQMSDQLLNSLDLQIFIDSITELFNWIWELWLQYGEEEYEFKYFGEDKVKGESIKITREEFQGKYTINVRGNDQNTNPQIKIQKAEFIDNSLKNPVALQMGIVTPTNVYNSMKRMYEILDVDKIDDYLTQPPEKPEPPPPPMPDVKINFEDLSPKERAQVLQMHGIKPDIQGQMLKKEQNDEDKATQTALDMAKVIK